MTTITTSTLYCGPPWRDFSLFLRSLFLLLFFTILVSANYLKLYFRRVALLDGSKI